ITITVNASSPSIVFFNSNVCVLVVWSVISYTNFCGVSSVWFIFCFKESTKCRRSDSGNPLRIGV
ncbi:unnamed protein product, partial [Larinioides sclopetarius]